MKQLGKLKKVSIREIWKKEPEFSKWLSNDENLKLLGEKIKVEILAGQTESDIGDFSADILAKEEASDRVVIIENHRS